MWNCNYDIIMQTPIGARYGTMTFAVHNSRVDGILDILKHANPFSGTIEENGECRIQGMLTTLMRTIPYQAAGRVTRDALRLWLNAAQETFEISGTPAAFAPSEEKEPTL